MQTEEATLCVCMPCTCAQVRAEEARVVAREDELAAMGDELEAVEMRVGAAQRQLARLEASARDPEAAADALVLREEGGEG